jgi:hypothetical protein
VKSANNVEELIEVIDQQIVTNATETMDIEPISPAEEDVQDTVGWHLKSKVGNLTGTGRNIVRLPLKTMCVKYF